MKRLSLVHFKRLLTVYLDSGEYSLVRSQNIYNDRFVQDGLAHITDEAAEQLSNVELQSRDVLLNITGDSVARCCMVDDSVLPARVNQHVSIIRPDEKKLFPEYLHYYLISPYMQSHMLTLAGAGATRNALTKGMIESFEIPCPPLDEQKRIAGILGSLDDKIENSRRMNETLEAMAAAIFKSWFVDFDPVHAKAAGRDTGLPKEIADLFPDSFDDSPLGEIPKGWKVGKLGDIASNPRRSINPDEIEPTIPYIGLQHMPRHSIALDSWGIAEEVDSGKSQFFANEILFGKLRPYFHKVGIASIDGVCSTDILVIKPVSDEWLEYILCLVSSEEFVQYANLHSSGTRMPRTNWKDMSRYTLALPPQNLAKLFQERLQGYIGKIKNNIMHSKTLSQTLDTLLPQLLSGEKEI